MEKQLKAANNPLVSMWVITLNTISILYPTAELVKITGKKQYEAYFIITNQDYMVVSHAPTMTVSLDREGRNMLTKLKEEAEALGSSITMVYSDRCCDVSFSKH